MHTQRCQEIQRKIENENHWYHIAYPAHCSECGGIGGRWEEDDPSPAGVSLSPGSYSYFEPCDECVSKGICPHCGEKLSHIAPDQYGPDQESDYFECKHCGWSEFSNPVGLNTGDECDCWEIGVKGL